MFHFYFAHSPVPSSKKIAPLPCPMHTLHGGITAQPSASEVLFLPSNHLLPQPQPSSDLPPQTRIFSPPLPNLVLSYHHHHPSPPTKKTASWKASLPLFHAHPTCLHCSVALSIFRLAVLHCVHISHLRTEASPVSSSSTEQGQSTQIKSYPTS